MLDKIYFFKKSIIALLTSGVRVIEVMIGYIGFTLHKFKGSGEPRTFFISDEELKFIIQDKPIFQIR